MSLVDEYRRQARWRPWASILGALPSVEGQTVLDLGCGVGDQSADLAARGARVIGIDGHPEFLRAAHSRRLRDAWFVQGDLRRALPLRGTVDGVWSSFSAAYFPDLEPTLASWTRTLRPGGWIAFTEIDDLFGHEPLGERTRSLLEGYVRDSLRAGRYDFCMGRRLRPVLEAAGFEITHVLTPDDQELSFSGPALPEVLEAWRTRLGRMKLLQEFCAPDFAAVRDEFLACLARPDHRSRARVVCCIARR